MKISQNHLIIAALFITTKTFSMSFSDTMKPLKDAIDTGQSIPMTQLPFVNMIPFPGKLKEVLNNIEILSPKYSVDILKQIAMVEGGAELFGQPVVIKILMAHGSLGQAAKEPEFLKQVQENKVDQSKLQELAKNTREETEQAESAWKKGELPTNPTVEQPKLTIGSQRELLQQIAPQQEVNLPVKEKAQVTQSVQLTKNKISDLAKGAPQLVKDKGKSKATFTDTIKGALSKLNVSIFIGLPKFQSFGAIDKNLEILDIVKFSNVMFVATTGDYYDTEWNRSFRKGFNIVGTARMSGPLEQINNLIGQNLTEVTLQGVINPDLFGSSLLAELPGKIKFNDTVETSGLMLRAAIVQAGFPITFSVLTGLNIKVPNQAQPLAFRTGLSFVPPTEFIVGGWLEGMWNNPFGLPYFSIGDMGIQAGMDLTTAASTLGILSLSRLGLRGVMGFADKKVEIASSISLSSASPDIMIHGKFTGGISINDIVNVAATIIEEAAKQSGKPISIKNQVTGKIPNLSLKDAEITISPKDVDLAGRYYKQGVMVDGVVDILGVTGELRAEIDKTSVEGLAYMSAINAGPFKLTGAGKDKKLGTPDDGPILNFNIKTGAPFIELFLAARAELDKRILGGAYGDTRVDFSTSGIEFRIKTKLFNEFLTNLEISAPDYIQPKDWKVVGVFEQEALTHFATLLEQAIKEIAQVANRDIEQAQQAVNNAKKKIDSLKPSKDALEAQINKCKGQSNIKAAPEQVKVIAEIDRKVQEYVPELTGKDIANQINELRRTGMNQSQLDQIEQMMWSKIANRELQASRDILMAFKNNPGLLNTLDPGTQTAIKAAISQEASTKIENLVALIEGQVEWTLNKLKQKGMPSKWVNKVRELLWKNELKNRYYPGYINQMRNAGASAGPLDIAINSYATNINRLDYYRKTGLTPEAVAMRMQNLKDLIREAIFASELLWKKIGAANVDKYIEDRWITYFRKYLERKLPK